MQRSYQQSHEDISTNLRKHQHGLNINLHYLLYTLELLFTLFQFIKN